MCLRAEAEQALCLPACLLASTASSPNVTDAFHKTGDRSVVSWILDDDDDDEEVIPRESVARTEWVVLREELS